MRLIDAEEVRDDLMYTLCGTGYQYNGLSYVDRAETIDPVHAAGGCYCRECDLWNDWDYVGQKELGNLACSCAHWTGEDKPVMYTRPDDFCSYGEPKERE